MIEARSQVLLPGFAHGWEGLRYLDCLLLLSKAQYRRLDLRWSSQDCQQHTYGIWDSSNANDGLTHTMPALRVVLHGMSW